MVPNPKILAESIELAIRKAGIQSETISYIESAANGSVLGDPIEITGLAKAYRKQTKDKAFCKIGTVKSNIGHVEAASGISQITKVLLQIILARVLTGLKFIMPLIKPLISAIIH